MSVPGFEIRHFEEIDSTNTYLVNEARNGATHGLVVTAHHQSSGRGRLGRTWEAPPGASLLASILLSVPLDASQLFLASVVVGLAARQAIEELTGTGPVLKWPNDLLFDEKKVSGLLAELVDRPQTTSTEGYLIVVGIGINLTWPGPPEAQGTSILEHTGVTISTERMLEALLSQLAIRIEQLHNPARHSEILDELRRHLATLGSPVRIELIDEEVIGRAIDVTNDGHLVLETEAGRREIVTGDVIHLRTYL
jgi:BirA family biotin operon repressor/biotin-[acetyl-CoA-carboxylase] ligase